MSKILNSEELHEIETRVERVERLTTQSLESIKTIINSFSNEEIVQSFYASGKYGVKEQEKLQQILDSITKYTDLT